jgi:hypothetical protein
MAKAWVISPGYVGDIAAGETLRFMFNSHDADLDLSTIAGGPVVEVFKDNDTDGTTTGLTVTRDFNSLNGCNQITVDTSTDESFYAAGSDYSVIALDATVDGTNINGSVLGQFSISNRSVNTDAVWSNATRTLTSGPTIVSDDLEYEEWTIVKGNSYSSGNQPKIFTMAEHGPTDLSEYTWAFTADIHADNENTGDSSFSGTVTVTTATGASRAVRVDLAATATDSLALGRYTGAIRGTDGSEKATPKIIAVTVVDDPNA